MPETCSWRWGFQSTSLAIGVEEGCSECTPGCVMSGTLATRPITTAWGGLRHDNQREEECRAWMESCSEWNSLVRSGGEAFRLRQVLASCGAANRMSLPSTSALASRGGALAGHAFS